MRCALYPGSFDPITNGHLDIIRRVAAIYEHVTVSVVVNVNKKCRFSIEERVDMLHDVTTDLNNVHVDSYSGLLADYCRSGKFTVLVRGLRTVSDFESELRMAQTNDSLVGIETVFMVTDPECGFSSSLVKGIGGLSGDVSLLIPATVLNLMM